MILEIQLFVIFYFFIDDQFDCKLILMRDMVLWSSNSLVLLFSLQYFNGVVVIQTISWNPNSLSLSLK